MNPTACYGCEKNPVKGSTKTGNENYQIYGSLIDVVGRMSDALLYGILDPSTVNELEFSLLRLYRRMMQSFQRI